ncbi:hypothetical protein Nepgr_010759 [Nepenthes gracilis]|uniref:Plastid division protein PDV1 n=1 Tax=Nepenthes gracilis TaxID=150966 RepID=A0AAD3SDJ1_NEPGR|nr:hypothetical protein Nepgr_010759 [Nepenthes gracilis]
MKWEMEIEEVEAVLEKIWDLHDKLSDAIHSISRTHFLNSIKIPRNPDKKNKFVDSADETRNGFVYTKDYEKDSAIAEAKSLNGIRTALENLEDQLEFFHTVQIQQRAERDAAIARLEQSRIILALRLAEHHGKRYTVIDEALDFVGDVRDATFISPENLFGPSPSAPVEHATLQRRNNSNVFLRVLLSGFCSARNVIKLDRIGGILGNAALFTFSMIAMLHLHRVAYNDNHTLEIIPKRERISKRISEPDGSSPCNFDVLSARG